MFISYHLENKLPFLYVLVIFSSSSSSCMFFVIFFVLFSFVVPVFLLFFCFFSSLISSRSSWSTSSHYRLQLASVFPLLSIPSPLVPLAVVLFSGFFNVGLQFRSRLRFLYRHFRVTSSSMADCAWGDVALKTPWLRKSYFSLEIVIASKEDKLYHFIS